MDLLTWRLWHRLVLAAGLLPVLALRIHYIGLVLVDCLLSFLVAEVDLGELPLLARSLSCLHMHSLLLNP